MNELTKIDLGKLNWANMDRLAKVGPEQVRKMREKLRLQIQEVGRHCKCPQLVSWATGLSATALDHLTHVGFLESTFWEALTFQGSLGNLPMHGLVEFKHPGILSGQHRQ